MCNYKLERSKRQHKLIHTVTQITAEKTRWFKRCIGTTKMQLGQCIAICNALSELGLHLGCSYTPLKPTSFLICNHTYTVQRIEDLTHGVTRTFWNRLRWMVSTAGGLNISVRLVPLLRLSIQMN